MFSRIDHKLEHKTILNKFKRIEIISSLFSEHNRMKLEINHMKRNEKKKNDCLETKQHVTKNQTMMSKRKFKNNWRERTIKHNHTKSMGCRKNSS